MLFESAQSLELGPVLHFGLRVGVGDASVTASVATSTSTPSAMLIVDLRVEVIGDVGVVRGEADEVLTDRMSSSA